jgi:hypothetical protein
MANPGTKGNLAAQSHTWEILQHIPAIVLLAHLEEAQQCGVQK